MCVFSSVSYPTRAMGFRISQRTHRNVPNFNAWVFILASVTQLNKVRGSMVDPFSRACLASDGLSYDEIENPAMCFLGQLFFLVLVMVCLILILSFLVLVAGLVVAVLLALRQIKNHWAVFFE